MSLDKLIAQYNASEDVQANRLKEIFEILDAQQGPRRLVCGDTAVQQFDKHSVAQFVTQHQRKISSWAEGQLA